MSLFCPKYRVVVRTFVQWIMAEYRIKRQHGGRSEARRGGVIEVYEEF